MSKMKVKQIVKKSVLLLRTLKQHSSLNSGYTHTSCRLLRSSAVVEKMNVTEVKAEQFHDQEKIDENTFVSKLSGKKLNIIVEGNIGVGKTTLINYFAKTSNVESCAEPVAKWRNLNGHNLLNLMYTDPQKWSMTFQSYVQLCMIDMHSRKQVKPVRLIERSLYSAKYCFVENLHRSGLMADADYCVLTEWFNWLIKSVNFSVDLIVYLRAEPEVVHQRILARSRPEEDAIPLEFIQELHRLHEDWLVRQLVFRIPAPVLVLDANSDLETMYKVYESRSAEILCNSKQQMVV